MDYAAWRFWLDIAQWALTGVIGFFLLMEKRQRVSTRVIDALKTEIRTMDSAHHLLLNEHEKRLSVVETECRTSPNHGDLAEMYKRINEVSDGMSDMAGEMRGMRRSLDMIHQHLLNERN